MKVDSVDKELLNHKDEFNFHFQCDDIFDTGKQILNI